MPTFQSLFASINRMVQQTDGDPLSKSQGKQDDVAYPKVKASRMM